MESSTEGATIYYTTDGTVPTENSPQYSKPVEFTKDVTVKAIAIKTGIENSPVSVTTVSIKEKKIVEIKTEYVDKKADETAPAKVTNLVAQSKDSRVFLSWTDAEDEDIYGYEITYSGTKPINRVVLPALDSKTMMAGKGAGGCYVGGLENGTEYTFTVKTVDTSGNKSEGVTVKATPIAGETMKIALTAAIPQENGYTGNKSNTKVTVTANITTASSVKKVVWKKDGSINAKTLLADEEAKEVTEDNAVWTFDITAEDESANGTYTVAATDEAGREEAEQITIESFDFTAPGKVKVTSKEYSSESAKITIRWTEPEDSDYDHADITFTSNDGTANSEPSEVVSVKKGTTEKTFSGIDSATKFYTYTFVTYDELGNKGAEYSVTVSKGFVKVTGRTITGKKNTNNRDGVFIEGRTVTLSDFFMSQYEVTQDEYSEVMTGQKVTVSGTEYTLNANPSYCTEANKSEYGVNFGTEQRMRPVESVTWYDAVYYCNARSKQEGLTSAYDIIVTEVEDGNITAATVTLVGKANGYRLPTEAEWEWLARGGENYTYAGSNTVGDVAWYTSNTSDTGTREVKTKQANGYGLYDMSGNVYEWCWDWSGSNRVRRGG